MKKYKPLLTKPDIDWLKDEFLPNLADAVEKRLKKKLDDISTKLDKFVGEVRGYREEQTLVADKLARHDSSIDRIKKHLHLAD